MFKRKKINNPDSPKYYFQLIRDNIGLHTSQNRIHTVGVMTLKEDPLSVRSVFQLANQFVTSKKRVCAIDLDTENSALRAVIPNLSQKGLSEILHEFFVQNFYTQDVKYYGFWDILYACFLRKKSCLASFTNTNNDNKLDILFHNGKIISLRDRQRQFEKNFLKNSLKIPKVSIGGLKTIFADQTLDDIGTLETLYQSQLLTEKQFALIYQKSIRETLYNFSQSDPKSFEIQNRFHLNHRPFFDLFSDSFIPYRSYLDQNGLFLKTWKKYIQNQQQRFDFLLHGERSIDLEYLPFYANQFFPFLKEQYDIAIFHLPNVLNNPESQKWASLIDTNIVFIDEGVYDSQQVKGIMRSLNEHNIETIGCVLSDASESSKIDFR